MEAIGSCYCARVEIASSQAQLRTVHCHCSQCRRLSGGAFSTWTSFPRAGFRVSRGSGFLRVFASSDHCRRHFCSHCGTHVFTEDSRYPVIVGVPAGALLDQQSIAPAAHFYTDDAAAWVALADDLPRFRAGTGT